MSSLTARQVPWSALSLLVGALSVLPAADASAQSPADQAVDAPPLGGPQDAGANTTDASPPLGADPAEFDDPPAHLAIADGAVTLERESVAEAAASGDALIIGDRLRTDGGRAEIYLPDGSVLDVDEFTTVELQGPGLLRLTAGRILLTLGRPASGTQPGGIAQYQVDTPAAAAVVTAPGEYRIGMLGNPSTPQVEVAVVRGRAELLTERGALPLNAGERSLAWTDGAAAYPERFNSARFDAFDRWAAAQRDQRTGTQSAQYLPQDLRTYSGAFDRSGAWQYDPSYGYVWYPAVAAGWQPYYNGYWSPLPRYGWTWIGLNVWSWPTHHYGRWGYASNRWFWIPGRRWAPGWVAWGSAPGYISWSPLGFGNRLLTVSVGLGQRGGWVVIPRNRFGVRGGYANQYALSNRILVARAPAVRRSLPPALPARVAAAGRVGPRSVRPAFADRRASAPALGRRSPAAPGGSRASSGMRLPPSARAPVGAARAPFGSAQRQRGADSLSGPQRRPSVVPRNPSVVPRNPSAVPRSGAPGFVPGSSSLSPGARFPGAVSRRPESGGSPPSASRPWGSAPRAFDAAPGGFNAVRPGGPVSEPRVRPRSGGVAPPFTSRPGAAAPRSGSFGTRGENRRFSAPAGGGSFRPPTRSPSTGSGGSFAMPRGGQPRSPAFTGGTMRSGGVSTRSGGSPGARPGGSMGARGGSIGARPAQPSAGGASGRGSRRPR
ncbi:MAG: DUF6600 domain-containing protein [Vicinamibacterales bacterium]